jgi:hypothetical protein
MSYFDADEIIKKVTKGTMLYELVRDENGAGDVWFRIVKTDNEKGLGEFYRDEFRDEGLANSVFNRIVRGEIRF